jgi:hypothetical protein
MRRTALAALVLTACPPPERVPVDTDDSATDISPPVTDPTVTTAPDPEPTAADPDPTTTSGPDTTVDPDTTAPGPTTDDPATTTTTTTTTDDTTTGSPVTCADLPLCDDFESVAAGGPPDPALWTVTSPNCSGAGTHAVDDAPAHGGGKSLRVDGGGGYCDHVFIAHSAAIDALGPVVHGRFWLRLGAPLGQGHVTFMTLRDSADGAKDLRMGGQSEVLMWNRESDDATLPVLSPAGIAMSVAPPVGAWTCVEFMVDEAGGRIDTWVDGAPVAGLVVDAEPTPDVDQQWHNKPNWKPSLADIKFGWESYAGQTMTLHLDDVALADTRLGCD